MPLLFSDTISAVFFWINLMSAAALAAGAVLFAFFGKKLPTAAAKSAAMLFFGLSLLCLAPYRPLIYAGALCAAGVPLAEFDNLPCKLAGSALFIASSVLALEGMCVYLSAPLFVPFVMLGAVLFGAALVCILSRSVLKNLSLVLALMRMFFCAGMSVFAILLFELEYYPNLLILFGALYLLATEFFPMRKESAASRGMFRAGFFLLGEALLFLGILLLGTAIH